MALASRWATVEDLERLSRRGERYELVLGELRPMSPVGARQGTATNRLSSRASVFALEHGLGEGFTADSGFRLHRDPDTVLAPDWAFVTRKRLPDPLPASFPELVPDLVLETRSPNDSRRKIEEKIRLWLEAGVQVVWDLDPERRTLTVYRAGAGPLVLAEEDTLTEPALLPGFSLALTQVFPRGGTRAREE